MNWKRAKAAALGQVRSASADVEESTRNAPSTKIGWGGGSQKVRSSSLKKGKKRSAFARQSWDQGVKRFLCIAACPCAPPPPPPQPDVCRFVGSAVPHPTPALPPFVLPR